MTAAVKKSAQLLLIALSPLAYTPEAHAYLDPGTGSLLLQGILAFIAGAAVTLRLYWGKFKSFFGRDRVSHADRHDERS